LLLDPTGRVLLMNSQDPGDRTKGTWWELPGGGIDRGETSADCAARELREETGYDGAEVGPVIWRRKTRFTFSGMLFDQEEEIHVAYLREPDSAPGDTELESLEVLAFLGSRWWTLDEVIATDERFYPTRLPELLPPIVAGDLPSSPLQIGD
jgi:8-oxo-dGTP pyrophosphatase MutT (NUDIX family)